MGKIDIRVKNFIKIDTVFAQLFSEGVFKGRIKIDPDKLQEIDTASALLHASALHGAGCIILFWSVSADIRESEGKEKTEKICGWSPERNKDHT